MNVHVALGHGTTCCVAPHDVWALMGHAEAFGYSMRTLSLCLEGTGSEPCPRLRVRSMRNAKSTVVDEKV